MFADTNTSHMFKNILKQIPQILKLDSYFKNKLFVLRISACNNNGVP